MNITLFLDGNFSTEQYVELNKKDYSFKWKLRTIPEKGDYIDLENFIKDLPDFCIEGSWKVYYRTFIDDNTIELYLIFKQ